MVKDAEAHAEEDKQRRELIEARNAADSLIYSTEKSLKEYGDKIDASQKKAIEDAIVDLKGALDKEDAEAIKSKTETLMQASMKLGEAVYKATQEKAEGGGAGGGEEAASSGNGADAKVVDAEFQEVDGEEKEQKKKKRKA